jgi:hypothetical protein
MKLHALALAAGMAASLGFGATASAQYMGGGYDGPMYRSWQPTWDNNQFDRRHVILGTVSDFHPYRLQVTRADGDTQTIDLKNGTRIFPTGMTPRINQRVAVVGYYSNGTFIANRVILRG